MTDHTGDRKKVGDKLFTLSLPVPFIDILLRVPAILLSASGNCEIKSSGIFFHEKL
jgi:hypothetical protein